jgi:predicted nucleic acid-binding Zn ribbon protein
LRRQSPRPAGFALESLVDSLQPPTLLAAVQRAWPKAAGEKFAHVSEPVSERDGVVVVACDSSLWASELDLMSERVVEHLNAALGREAVRRLKPRATRA